MACEREEMRAGEPRGGDLAHEPALPSGPDRRREPTRATAGRTLERLDGLVDNIDLDPPPLVGVADDEAVIAQNVDAAWDPARVHGNPGLSLLAEEPEVVCAGNTETCQDVVADLLPRQRGKATP